MHIIKTIKPIINGKTANKSINFVKRITFLDTFLSDKYY